ncbi:class I adenylate-forming enzyme family protein [Hydrogenophaga sp.]|uniref:class I adenylate-forming enzyme family protein n=1 Tax=Hydrogenophaga sp. TaxID=1904254 RepID=UPI002AB86A29|nr:AMP-binding protein [Hydrogenophaga sp.]MDZ4397526.1 AMP-binding protein [Hydrogenophaga sp.]
MNPFDFFTESARRYPSRLALEDETRKLSYFEAEHAIHCLACRLHDAGVRSTHRVGVFSPNCVEALIAALAVFRLGAVWVPVNTRNSVQQNIEYLNGCDLFGLIFHKELQSQAHEISIGIGVRLLDLDTSDGPVELTLPQRGGDSSAVCAMLSTGGTTGSPKAVVWNERMVQTMIASFWMHLPGDERSAYLAATPLTHAAGVIALCMLAKGAAVLIHRSFKAEEYMAAIEEMRVTHLFLPPTAIYGLLVHPDLILYDFSSLQAFIYSAAPMAAEKIRQAVEAFGPVMVQLYGQAEAPLMCTILSPQDHIRALDCNDEHLLQSCGRSTLMVQVEIMDESGEILPPRQIGEVVLRSDLVMEYYYGHPKETEEVRRFGWHHTGDIGFKDEEGFVLIVDRAKDMIISGGFNVFSSEVEAVVLAHPAVQDCAVVGKPDEKWGEAVTAVVQLKPGASLDPENLKALCRDRLGAVKAPKAVEIWADLPRSPVGKVLKRRVRDVFWEGRERRV